MDCGKHTNFKMSISDRNRVINTNTDSMTTLLSFYDVRKEYLKLKKQQLSIEEIVEQLNRFYKNQEHGSAKKLIKN